MMLFDEAVRRCCLAGGSVSLGLAESLAFYNFLFTAYALCLWLKNAVSVSYFGRLLPQPLCDSLELLGSKETLPSSTCIWSWCFIIATPKYLMQLLITQNRNETPDAISINTHVRIKSKTRQASILWQP